MRGVGIPTQRRDGDEVSRLAYGARSFLPSPLARPGRASRGRQDDIGAVIRLRAQRIAISFKPFARVLFACLVGRL